MGIYDGVDCAPIHFYVIISITTYLEHFFGFFSLFFVFSHNYNSKGPPFSLLCSGLPGIMTFYRQDKMESISNYYFVHIQVHRSSPTF